MEQEAGQVKYVGSKSRIAPAIVPIIQEHIQKSGARAYVEPFVGGANVIDKIAAEYRIGFDINGYLIALLQYVKSGGLLPDTISREQYAAIRSGMHYFPAWKVGAAGFLASYNGKFFGGYAGKVKTKQGERDYYDEARRNLQNQAQAFQNIDFARFDYRNISFTDCVIYADPPYLGTTGYNREKFDTAEFWNVVRGWSERNIVLVSEQTAPPDFKCIWEGDVKRTQDNASRKTVTERLFIYERGYST